MSKTAPAPIVSRAMFRFLADMEIRKAERLHYSVSVIGVVPDVPAKGGTSASPATTEQVAQHLRGTDVILRVGVSSFLVLLVDANTPSLAGIFRRVVGCLPPLPVGGDESSTWSGGAASFPETVSDARTLIQQASALMARARADGGNRFYVRSEAGESQMVSGDRF